MVNSISIEIHHESDDFIFIDFSRFSNQDDSLFFKTFIRVNQEDHLGLDKLLELMQSDYDSAIPVRTVEIPGRYKSNFIELLEASDQSSELINAVKSEKDGKQTVFEFAVVA